MFFCFKRPFETAKLSPILATHPSELVHMDYPNIKSSKGDQDVNILVVTDHFLKICTCPCNTLSVSHSYSQGIMGKYFVCYDFP